MENQHSDFFWTDELVYKFIEWKRNLSRPIYNPIEDFKKLYKIEKVTESVNRQPKKDYEIFSTKDNSGAIYYTDMFVDGLGEVIHSVKRLSDGEIFTIGDKFNCIADKTIRSLDYFYIPNNSSSISGVDKDKGGIPISDMVKAKEDYEIVEFKHKSMGYMKWYDGTYHRTNSEYYNTSLRKVPENAEIISIKRLSGGEVFSVGDVIKVYRQTGYKGERAITGFSVVDDELVVEHNGCKSSLYQIAKSKKPLFTTEDGVEVFEGDRIVLLNTETWLWACGIKAPRNPFAGDVVQYKYFSTKEASDNYILMNKPVLSVNDIISQPCGFTIDLPKILKKLAKSRIWNQ
jgi:hypothetical protein